MTTTDDPGTALVAGPRHSRLPDPGERGTTTVADKVVEKTAARAALDVPHVQGLGRSVVGRAFGAKAVRADVIVDGRTASLKMELAVEYPASARLTTRQVRRRVRELLGGVCDLTVDHIDITVAVLRRERAERKRVQ